MSTYNNVIWGNEYISYNNYIDTSVIENNAALSNKWFGDEPFIKNMVKLSDGTIIVVGKFKYIYLKKGNDNYRLEVNSIIKFNVDGSIDESFLKFDANNHLYWNGFNSPKQPKGAYNGVLYNSFGDEILPSINDIIVKNNNLYLCGAFSTYRGLGVFNNKSELDSIISSTEMIGKNSLIKISHTNGNIDINTRFVFDIDTILGDDCNVNTLSELDSDNILVGGDFTNFKFYTSSGNTDYKKSSLMKFNITSNSVSNFWDCSYYNLNIYTRDYICINKGIHMDLGYKFIINGGVNSETTYMSNSNFYPINDFQVVYNKKNKEIKKILVIDESPSVKSIFVVGNFNCYLDGTKKHWLNRILKFDINGNIDPTFLPGHSATNYTYIQGEQTNVDGYVVNDKNTGFGFSSFQIAFSSPTPGEYNVYMSDTKIVDSNGDRIVLDYDGNLVNSVDVNSRYIAYDDEFSPNSNVKSYVSDIIYHNNTILVCGKFNFYKNNGGNYKNLNNIIRLNLDGSVDTQFDYTKSHFEDFYSIDSIKLVNNGDDILIGGKPKYQGNLNILQSGETKNVFLKIKSNGDLVSGSDNNLKFRYYSVNDNTTSFIAKIPYVNKIF